MVVAVQARGFPEINIICEKVAFEGVTRFEDRWRLPLGISFNMSAFSATIMSQVRFPGCAVTHLT